MALGGGESPHPTWPWTQESVKVKGSPFTTPSENFWPLKKTKWPSSSLIVFPNRRPLHAGQRPPR